MQAVVEIKFIVDTEDYPIVPESEYEIVQLVYAMMRREADFPYAFSVDATELG
jgi:hypothetical protein